MPLTGLEEKAVKEVNEKKKKRLLDKPPPRDVDSDKLFVASDDDDVGGGKNGSPNKPGGDQREKEVKEVDVETGASQESVSTTASLR